MKRSLPRVSLITPAYNQGAYLGETIASVLGQSYPAIDYLVVDDGSTDSTAEVLKGFGPRVRWRRQDNRGQVATLNAFWTQAQGTYLSYLSSDDTLHPDAIAAMVDALEADPDAVCAFPDADLIDSNSRVVRRSVCRRFDAAALVVEQECHIGPGALFRRSAFEAVGGWREDLKLAPDREFWMRLARLGSFIFVPRPLAGYRLHTGSISYRVVSEAASLEYLRVLDDYFAGNVCPAIRARQQEAYGRAHFLIARNCYRAMAFDRGNWHYSRARALHPPLGSLSSRLVIARTVVSKPLRTGLARLRRQFG